MSSPLTVQPNSSAINTLSALAVPSSSSFSTSILIGKTLIPADIWIEIFFLAALSPPDRSTFRRILPRTVIGIDVGPDPFTIMALKRTCRPFKRILDSFWSFTSVLNVALPLKFNSVAHEAHGHALRSARRLSTVSSSLEHSQPTFIRMFVDNRILNLTEPQREEHRSALEDVLCRANTIIVHGQTRNRGHGRRLTKFWGVTSLLPNLRSLTLDHVYFSSAVREPTFTRKPLIELLRLLPGLQYARFHRVRARTCEDATEAVTYGNLTEICFKGQPALLAEVLRHATVIGNLRLTWHLTSDEELCNNTGHARSSPLSILPASSTEHITTLELLNISPAIVIACPLLTGLRVLSIKDTNIVSDLFSRLNIGSLPCLERLLLINCSFRRDDIEMWLRNHPMAIFAGYPFCNITLLDCTVTDGDVSPLVAWMKERVQKLRWSGGGLEVDHVRDVTGPALHQLLHPGTLVHSGGLPDGDEEEHGASDEAADGHDHAEGFDDADEHASSEADDLETANEFGEDIEVEPMIRVEAPEETDLESTD